MKPVQTAPIDTSPGPDLEAVVRRVREISTLPAVALHVMEIAADPESGAADLTAAVEADPALCARVLRCVNSAAFGLRTQIESLGQAVSYLGFNQIRDLAVTATVSGLFRSSQPIHHYDRGNLWRHLVAVGVCTRMIGARRKVPGFENAFLAGLLHDLGIILFDQHAHPEFRQVMISLNDSRTLPEFERKVLRWDHTELGAAVATAWKLPPSTITAMRHHHEPEKYEGPHEPVLHCVALANLVCSLKEITSVGLNLVGLHRRSLEVLDLDKADLKTLSADLDREMEANQHLFDIQKGG
jgi:HD-like signal output (HDOD) protein